MREELTEHFERTIGRPPAGAQERVIAGFWASVDRSSRRRLEWAATAAAIVLALLVVGALMLSRLGPRLQPAGQQQVPEPRSGAAVAFDASRHVLVLFGGTTDDQRPLNDTWTWDGHRWTRLHPPSSPPRLKRGALMAYDGANGTLVLYGGPGSTWTWDGTTWSDHPASAPGGQPAQSAMAYDPATRSVLLHTTLSDARTHETWSWDGTSWTQLHPAVVPDVVDGAMAFDGERLLLVGTPFGMVQGRYVTETWAWDGSTWSQPSPAIRLPVPTTYSVAYDEAHGRLVAFIQASDTGAAETWTWDGATWRKEQPAHLPPPRRGGALVYDPAARTVLLYGGIDARSVALDDIWTWDGGDWTLRKEATR